MSVQRDEVTEIFTAMDLPEGAVILRAVEIIQFLAPDGQEVVAARWQGNGNVVAELGMMEYAKQELILARFQLSEDIEAEDTEDDHSAGSGS